MAAIPIHPRQSREERSHAQGYLQVAVPAPLRQTFTYRPPAGVDPATLQPGIRVKVPFGRRSVTGILVTTAAETTIEESRVKRATALIDARPVLDPAVIRLCLWATDYYHHPVGEVFATALPVLLRRGAPVEKPHEVLRITATGRSLDLAEMKAAPRQLALLRLLRARGTMTRTELKTHDITHQVMRAVVDKGLAALDEVSAPRVAPFDPNSVVVENHGIELTHEQASAVEAIGGGVTLLFGVTGSGKTEVYLRLIERVLESGQQVLVLVPEIGLTPQTISRFTARFNVPVVAMHSALTDRERLDAWNAGRSGSAAIIIGTRSAMFMSLNNPGLIIVDEEHDGSFKQQDGFRYSARDLAVVRGQQQNVPVVLGSATPSLETWHNARTGKYRLVQLTSRPGRATAPNYRVINIRNQPLTEGFARVLLDDIGSHLAEGNQVLVFLNRRGFSPVLLCRQCGWISQCHRCDARMTLHRSLQLLICHHCTSQMRIPQACPQCDGAQLVPLGAGTQRLEGALNRLFPEYRVLRVDRDSTRHKRAMDGIYAEVNTGAPALLVGTQLLAKGHHFPDVTLVAIMDMDAGFYSADYKSSERMGQMILQVGGRAGRAEKPGTVAIQTYFPDQPIFRTLIHDGYAIFADRLLDERREHELPPFFHQALIRAEATTDRYPLTFLESIERRMASHPSVMVLGPVPAPMERRAGRYRAHLLLACDNRGRLKHAIDDAIGIAEEDGLAPRVRWSVDVDPVDLF